jgi:hypothetical protein
MVFPLALCN